MNDLPIYNLLSKININVAWLGLKALFLMGFVIYLVFSLVVLSQIKQMTKTLNGSMDLPLLTLGTLNVVLAVGAMLVAIVIL
jgi:hypothetical protein